MMPHHLHMSPVAKDSPHPFSGTWGGMLGSRAVSKPEACVCCAQMKLVAGYLPIQLPLMSAITGEAQRPDPFSTEAVLTMAVCWCRRLWWQGACPS